MGSDSASVVDGISNDTDVSATVEMGNLRTNHFDDSPGDYANLRTMKADVVTPNIRGRQSDSYYDVSTRRTIVVCDSSFTLREWSWHSYCLFHYPQRAGLRVAALVRDSRLPGEERAAASPRERAYICHRRVCDR